MIITYLVLGVFSICFLVLGSNFLLKTFAHPRVLISAGAFVFEAGNGMREEVLLEEVKRLAMSRRDVLILVVNLTEQRIKN